LRVSCFFLCGRVFSIISLFRHTYQAHPTAIPTASDSNFVFSA
jgi:hypothetical protein